MRRVIRRVVALRVSRPVVRPVRAAHRVDGLEDPTVLERFEESPGGRRVLSVAIGSLLLAIVSGNFSTDALLELTQPLRNATGLQQNWKVFSPPRNVSAYVEGRVDCRDGSATAFPITARTGLGTFIDYRWQKYEEVVRPDDGRALWPDFAEYVANRARSSGCIPLRVTLVRRWADTLPPGPGAQRGAWREAVMYVQEVRA